MQVLDDDDIGVVGNALGRASGCAGFDHNTILHAARVLRASDP
jgi:hypothetical protein